MRIVPYISNPNSLVFEGALTADNSDVLIIDGVTVPATSGGSPSLSYYVPTDWITLWFDYFNDDYDRMEITGIYYDSENLEYIFVFREANNLHVPLSDYPYGISIELYAHKGQQYKNTESLNGFATVPYHTTSLPVETEYRDFLERITPGSIITGDFTMFIQSATIRGYVTQDNYATVMIAVPEGAVNTIKDAYLSITVGYDGTSASSDPSKCRLVVCGRTLEEGWVTTFNKRAVKIKDVYSSGNLTIKCDVKRSKSGSHKTKRVIKVSIIVGSDAMKK